MWTGQRGVGRWARVLVAVVAAVGLGSGFARPAFADEEQTQFDAVRAQFAWTSWADARPISPFVGIPFEFTTGVPWSRSFLDSTPGRAEAFASSYTLDDTLEETAQLSGYENKTLTRSNFPDVGRGTEKEWAPAGANGPRTAVKTPNRTEAHSEARNGPGNESSTVNVGWGKTQTMFDRKGLIVAETTGGAQRVQLGDGGSIGTVESLVRVEHRLNEEPKVTYRITLAGVQVGGQQLVGVDDKGFTLAGSKVAGRDLADQFNTQAKEHGDTLDKLAKLSLQVLAPRVERDKDGAYLTTGPVLLFRSDNTPRKDQTLDNAGLRLGYVRTYTYLINVANSENAGQTAPPEAITSHAGGEHSASATDPVPARRERPVFAAPVVAPGGAHRAPAQQRVGVVTSGHGRAPGLLGPPTPSWI